jgi:diguanylate cyclase (GGDEF)-like protein
MSPHVLGRMLQRRPAVAVAGALVTVVGVGWIDRVTGDRISFSLFYLIPVAAAAWVAGSRIGVLVSLFASVTSLLGDVWGVGFQDVVPVWNALVRLGVLLVIAIALGQLKTSLEVQRELANTDPLTGVLNPRAFDAIAERELARYLRYQRPLALAYIDLDRFKLVNDTLGHSIGDRLLQTVASELVAHVRPSDVVVRMGGDEFAVLMPETTLEEAGIAFERIREQVLERMRFHGWPVNLSVGLSTCSGPGSTVDALIADADRAMYEDKRRTAARREVGATAAEPASIA